MAISWQLKNTTMINIDFKIVYYFAQGGVRVIMMNTEIRDEESFTKLFDHSFLIVLNNI